MLTERFKEGRSAEWVSMVVREPRVIDGWQAQRAASETTAVVSLNTVKRWESIWKHPNGNILLTSIKINQLPKSTKRILSLC